MTIHATPAATRTVAMNELSHRALSGLRPIVHFDGSSTLPAWVEYRPHRKGGAKCHRGRGCPPRLRPRDSKGRFVSYSLAYGPVVLSDLVGTDVVVMRWRGPEIRVTRRARRHRAAA